VKHWQPHELRLLATLRARFLDGTAGEADYWRSNEELALYDEVFATRIGWKIGAVIRNLQRIGWSPRSRRIADWGCGTGIATRRLLSAWPEIRHVGLHDRSQSAVRFARERIAAECGDLTFAPPKIDRDTLLLISHVLNELSAEGEAELLGLIESAGEVIWIDAGTHAESRRLIAIREKLLAIDSPPSIVAPCTHMARCGLLTSENARHWCHHFAEPPPGVFQDARWAELSRELGIDLRALPYSYLVLTRHTPPQLTGAERIIGFPRDAKGFCRILTCAEEGVRDLMLQKRDDPALYKSVLKTREYAPYRWEFRAGKITGGKPVDTSQE
jgi:ribosomal protein RSM22 (predicted rRNA methylase)